MRNQGRIFGCGLFPFVHAIIGLGGYRMKTNRLFALEEGYVTIFEEYTFFWNIPILLGSRTIDSQTGQWQMRYDITGRSGMKVAAHHSTFPNYSKFFKAKWSDLYMSDIRWDKSPITVDHVPAGLPGDFQDTIGHNGKLSFNAAHYNNALWSMTGFRKSWRVFVDFKREPSSPIERTWEFRGCTVTSNDYSGSPLTLNRGFKVREIPETDGIHTLDPELRGRMTFVRGDQISEVEILDIKPTDGFVLTDASYVLKIEPDNLTWKFTYNNVVTNFAWAEFKVVAVPGGSAGTLYMMMNGAAGPSLAKQEDILVVQ